MLWMQSVLKGPFIFLVFVVGCWGISPAAAMLPHPFAFEEDGFAYRPVVSAEDAQQVATAMPSFGFVDDGEFFRLNEYIAHRTALASGAEGVAYPHLIHPWAVWQGGQPQAWFVFNKPTHRMRVAEGEVAHVSESVMQSIYGMTLPILDGYGVYLPVQAVDMGFADHLRAEQMRDMYRTLLSYLAEPWIGETLSVAPFRSDANLEAALKVEPFGGIVFPFSDDDMPTIVGDDAPQVDDDADEGAYEEYRQALVKWVQWQAFWSQGIQIPCACVYLESLGEEGVPAQDGMWNPIPDHIVSLDETTRYGWRAYVSPEMQARLDAYIARVQAPLRAIRAEAAAAEAAAQHIAAVEAEQARELEAASRQAEQEEYAREYARLSREVRLKGEATVAAGAYQSANQRLSFQERQAGLAAHFQTLYNLSAPGARALMDLVIEGYVGTPDAAATAQPVDWTVEVEAPQPTVDEDSSSEDESDL